MDAHSRMGEMAKVVGQMARYIDADLIKNIEPIPYKRASENINAIIANVAIVGAKQVVDKIPTADVVPAIHAHWREYLFPAHEHVYCSHCNEEYYEDDLLLGGNDFPNYCPHCGAKMDEVK